MRLAWASLFLTAFAAACGTDESQQNPSPDASVEDSPNPNTASAVSFEDDGTITLLPGQARTVSVVVEPPGVHGVRFALFGVSLDASLNADYQTTDPPGRASVVLTAPRSATTFRIRATADDGPSAEVAVSVSGDGFATVLVRPASYQGRRATPTWTASAVARTACAALPGAPPVDGPIVADAPDGTAVRLEGLPVGPSVAVTLRAGQSVGGCRDVKDLTAGETRTVEVPVTDTPVQLAETDLQFQMAIAPQVPEFDGALDESSAEFQEAFLPSSTSEATALLNTMGSLSPDESEFEMARAEGDWDQLLGGLLDQKGVQIRHDLDIWIAQGLEPIASGNVVEGGLVAQGASAGHAILGPSRLGELDATAAGLPDEILVSLAAAPKDAIQLGGSLLWLPSRLIAASADYGASQADSTAGSATALIVSKVGCESLADALEQTAPLPSSCDPDCIHALCESSIAARWAIARDSSAAQLDVGTLTFTVSASAEVTPLAVISAFEGAWAGTYVRGTTTVSLKGTATASSP